jgi:hypothetical protein
VVLGKSRATVDGSVFRPALRFSRFSAIFAFRATMPRTVWAIFLWRQWDRPPPHVSVAHRFSPPLRASTAA